MTKPLALIFYENLMPGSQLPNRLQDLGYRAQTILDGSRLEAEAEQKKPLVIVMDLDAKRSNSADVMKALKANPATHHIPILGFTNDSNKDNQARATAAGAALVAMDTGFLAQLPQLLEHALLVE